MAARILVISKSTPRPMSAPTVFHTSIAEFVDPKVKTILVTDQIIAAIMPYFPKSAKVISGWLSDEDLYWKVNFHWDYLLEAIEHCEGLDIAQSHKNVLAAIEKAMWTNAPNPARGYRTSNVGEPKDSSSREVILKRHAVVKQAKIDFKDVVTASGLLQKTKRGLKQIALAYAPVAPPGKGKHVTGYALDIKGDNPTIKRIAKSLGSTLAFDEVSHVHCEWKNGVDKSAKSGSDSLAGAERGTKMNIENKITNVHHCLLRTA
jgi:hypothetical protein